MAKQSTQQQTAAVGSWNVPESISEPVSAAAFTGVNLEWDQRSSKISPGVSLCNWDQNSAQVKLRKNPTEAVCLEHAPCSVSSVPITHRQREKSANHNTGKNVLRATSGLGSEEQLLLLFSLVLYCYCWMGGEKRRSVNISGGGRKWCDSRAWFHSCQLWSDSFWFSRALCQHKNPEHVRIVPTQSEVFHWCLWRQRAKIGWKLCLLFWQTRSSSGSWSLEKWSSTTWHKGCHSQPSHFQQANSRRASCVCPRAHVFHSHCWIHCQEPIWIHPVQCTAVTWLCSES